MYGANYIHQPFSWSKILTGLSKGLNMANQILPIYEEVKPIMKNAKKVFKVMQELNIFDNKTNQDYKTNVESNNKIVLKKKTGSSLPSFFQ